MIGSIRLARVRGIEIKVHVLTLVIIGLVVLLWSEGSFDQFVFAGLFTTLLFSCVILHELGHGLVAQMHGIRVRDILLLPIGGVARLEEVPEHPWTELKVALAGPAVNLGIFLILSPIVAVAGMPALLAELLGATPARGPLGELVGLLWMANFLIFAFNLLPAFPLDGGRIFRAFLATRGDYVRATTRAATVGKIAAAGLILLGFVLGGAFFWLIVVGLFLILAGTNELRLVRLRHAYPRPIVLDGIEVLPPESPDAVPPGVRPNLLFDFGVFHRREVLDELDRFLRGADRNGHRRQGGDHGQPKP